MAEEEDHRLEAEAPIKEGRIAPQLYEAEVEATLQLQVHRKNTEDIQVVQMTLKKEVGNPKEEEDGHAVTLDRLEEDQEAAVEVRQEAYLQTEDIKEVMIVKDIEI